MPRSARWIPSRQALLVGVAVVVAVLLTVFRSWEPGDETWPYWYWARVLRESGRFVVLDRSPLYTLYLNAFTWVPFHAGIVAEYVVSTAIVGLSLVAFGYRLLGRSGSVLAALAWIPFLQAAEPPVQKLALAAALVAVLVRVSSRGRGGIAASYSLLLLAYLFRTTWLALLATFVVYDVWRSLHSGGIASLGRAVRPRPRTDWPVVIPFLALAWFMAMQSQHPWNNIFGSTSTWFPSRVTSFSNGTFLAVYNAAYSQLRYGEDRDWYFTNREAFDGAQDMFAAVAADPRFVAEQIVRFTVAGVRVAGSMTVLDPLLSWVPGGVFLEAILLVALTYGALRASRSTVLRILFVGSLFMMGLTIAAGPRPRYMVPLIPLLLLATSFYAGATLKLLDRVVAWRAPFGQRLAVAAALLAAIAGYVVFLASRLLAGRYVPVGPVTAALFTVFGIATVLALLSPRGAAHALLARTALPMVAILLSPGLVIPVPGATSTSWESVAGDVLARVRAGEIRVIQDSAFSFTAAEPQLGAILQNCSGIMALEHRPIGAFIDVPLARIRDIWEIPPFGRLGDPAYDGLRPERVDCVVVSTGLTTGVGSATNTKVRYENYVRPYVERLIAEGAHTYGIDRFGMVVVAAH